MAILAICNFFLYGDVLHKLQFYSIYFFITTLVVLSNKWNRLEAPSFFLFGVEWHSSSFLSPLDPFYHFELQRPILYNRISSYTGPWLFMEYPARNLARLGTPYPPYNHFGDSADFFSNFFKKLEECHNSHGFPPSTHWRSVFLL